MYNREKVIEDCKKVCKELGCEFTAPVKINGRLTLTLGRVINGYDENGEYGPLSVEFSKEMLETATDSAIYSVIQHEMVHYYISKTTHERHGHDKLFKYHCQRIGCKNDGCSTNIDRSISPKSLYKYILYCNNCKEPIGYYRKFSKTLKNIENYKCARCGSKDLYYVKNERK